MKKDGKYSTRYAPTLHKGGNCRRTFSTEEWSRQNRNFKISHKGWYTFDIKTDTKKEAFN